MKSKLESARLDAIGISGFDVTGGNPDLDMIDRAIEKSAQIGAHLVLRQMDWLLESVQIRLHMRI